MAMIVVNGVRREVWVPTLAAPAIAAGLFDATGKSARRLPLKADYVQALLKA